MRKLSGSSRPKNTKPRLPKHLAPPSKAQLAAMDRYIRDAERETGIKITKERVDAIRAEMDALE